MQSSDELTKKRLYSYRQSAKIGESLTPKSTHILLDHIEELSKKIETLEVSNETLNKEAASLKQVIEKKDAALDIIKSHISEPLKKAIQEA